MKTRHTVLGMLASAIVAFQMGSLLSAWSDLSPSFTGQISLAASEHNAPFGGSAGDAVLMKDEQQKQLNLTQQDPFYWIADEQDDFYERIYVDPTPLTHLRRNLTIKHFFPHLCGLYRFDIERLPTVSVVIPLRNEVPGMVSITVHAILARTPPSLLVEIIIVDDSDVKLNPELLQLTEVSGYNKVIVIPTTDREGCARSRLIGARAARGTVLVFVDSHVEMLSSTWYQHLVLPIVENPHTITSQQLEVMTDLANHTYDDPVSRGSFFGMTTDKFFFGWDQVRFRDKPYEELAPPIAPYEMPFAPGALFAIRKDEFWRLGGYDKGLYVWGAENMELSLKIWLCGGRLVQVPCSSTGHMFRIFGDRNKWANDNFTDLEVKLGVDGDEEGNFVVYGYDTTKADIFTRIEVRNNIRVAKIWLGDWRKYYYKEVFGSMELQRGWAKFEEDDEYMKEQIGFKEKNQCRDFDWFDKHVYMKILGTHTPWYAARQMDLNANGTLNGSNPQIVDSQRQPNMKKES